MAEVTSLPGNLERYSPAEAQITSLLGAWGLSAVLLLHWLRRCARSFYFFRGSGVAFPCSGTR